MHEASSTRKSIQLAPAVFFAALAGSLIIGWMIGLAPDALGGFGRFILYWLVLPVCFAGLAIGLLVAVFARSLSGLPRGSNASSFVLSPEELRRWRSIKPGMDRHEVTEIIGQPDGPPKVVITRLLEFRELSIDLEGKVIYRWGGGSVYFYPNGGPVFQVKIPEYI